MQWILSNPLKPAPDKGKKIFKMLTVYQHPDLFLHAAKEFYILTYTFSAWTITEDLFVKQQLEFSFSFFLIHIIYLRRMARLYLKPIVPVATNPMLTSLARH